MATLAQHTYNLLNMVRGGVLSDDETISYMQVQFWIHNTRALLIRQDIQKGRSISGNIVQILPCLDVDVVDASTCPCSLPIGCTILRTRNRVPKPIETDVKDLITKITPIGVMDRPYTFINSSRAPFTGYNKYAKSNPKAFYLDGYIWIINAIPVEKITVYGVFEDPTVLKDYVDCSGDPCYSDDTEYPMSTWMAPMMEKLIMENNFKITVGSAIDQTGNAKSDIDPVVNK